ncbi:MAG TPA: helix-turn-helix transcriptional regulator [Candidatus Elarobacter sp.]|jgi:transcriptional regulator with XRE-family HTH domain|nr:helix-turn-helix transcriptional regulator [Candidatus Elarobacter sp.]
MGVVEEVAERLVRLRLRAGLDPDRAAEETGIGEERLTAAESGAVTLTDEELVRVASAYGVDPTEIFGGRVTPLQDYAGGA